MKRCLLAIATFAMLAPGAKPVSAQGLSEWGMWDGPRRYRQAPPVYRQQYDEDYGDEAYFDVPPAQSNRARRYPQRWQDEEEFYEPRSGRRERQPEYDEFEGDDEGPFASPRGPDGKPIGVSGGARPVIAAVAPAVVAFRATYPVGSIVIDTSARKLYYVRSAMSAFAYPIGVGRDGFSWTGSEKVSRIAEWPDWYPPAEMRKRRPELPERMLGGLNNPLGAKAIYLGNTLYRIHGTNEPKSIGRSESSGCFRMLNQHVMHLASLVQVGATVTVVRALGAGEKVASAKPPAAPEKAVVTAPAARPPQPANRARVQWSADPDPRPSEMDDDRYR